jgi:hypothetical protein
MPPLGERSLAFAQGLRQTLLMRYALPAAIVLAGALIAASVAMTNRWAISNAGVHPGAYRLDRWTGQIMWCIPAVTQAPNPLNCQPPDWVSVPK